jgi:hypothetical protein
MFNIILSIFPPASIQIERDVKKIFNLLSKKLEYTMGRGSESFSADGAGWKGASNEYI